MLNLKDFNQAHDRFIKQINFDYDYSYIYRKQELRITYAVSIEEKQTDGNFKRIGYDYFRMIFDNPSSSNEPFLILSARSYMKLYSLIVL